ncbi:MAG: argininosuccinate lyase [Kiritimatiellia bacterium]
MKNIWSCVLLSCVLFAAPALALNLDFELANETGVDIYEIYISPSEMDEWGDDILEDDILEDGDVLDVSFDPYEESELWDIMVVDGDGNAIYWTGLDLTTISTVTLNMNNSSR